MFLEPDIMDLTNLYSQKFFLMYSTVIQSTSSIILHYGDVGMRLEVVSEVIDESKLAIIGTGKAVHWG